MLGTNGCARFGMVDDGAIADGELLEVRHRDPLIVKEETRWHVEVADLSSLASESTARACADEHSWAAGTEGEMRDERGRFSSEAIALKIWVAAMRHNHDRPPVSNASEEFSVRVWGEWSRMLQPEMRNQGLRLGLHRNLNEKIG